jgi:Ca2+-binding RTX toxin-like protein
VNLHSERTRHCEHRVYISIERPRRCHRGGTERAETVLGTGHSDRCRGGAGDDIVEGAGGSDRLFGDAGNDKVFGRFGNDLMFGGDGNDELAGGRNNDVLFGGNGNDLITGGYDFDRIDGGYGNDRVRPGWDAPGEFVDCGPGYDWAILGPGDRQRNCERVTRHGNF